MLLYFQPGSDKKSFSDDRSSNEPSLLLDLEEFCAVLETTLNKGTHEEVSVLVILSGCLIITLSYHI